MGEILINDVELADLHLDAFDGTAENYEIVDTTSTDSKSTLEILPAMRQSYSYFIYESNQLKIDMDADTSRLNQIKNKILEQDTDLSNSSGEGN